MSVRLIVVSLAVLARLAAPAGAQLVTLGSPLTAEPNISIDCALQPAIADVQGNYALFNSGQPDCTWRQAGVFGVTSGDPRFSSVPGDGRIISVTVRSGPAPVAPLRFAIFRQLASPGSGGTSQCCFFVGETNAVQPAPNSTQTFLTDIPVQRNTIDGIQAVDLIGISAASGTGSLPLHSTGRNNAFDLTTPGSVNAGIFYPRIGALANDAGGGRREEGIPGVEVLIQWTWCPAAAGGSGPGTCGTAGVPFVNNQNAPVRGGRALVDLLCNGDQACRGRLELLGLGTRAVTANATRYGGRSYRIQPGASATVPVKLNAKAKRLVKRNGSVQATVRIRPVGHAATTGTVVLTR